MNRPRGFARERATYLAALGLLVASPALGVTCHCLRDRSYNPAEPRAVEPYLRATAGNSLLSAVFGVPKGDLVQALMGGPASAAINITAVSRSLPSRTRYSRGLREADLW